MVNQPLTAAAPDAARALPDFAVIGAMRAGTTLLYDLLAAHEETCLPEMKEADYFIAEKNYARGETWYQQLFGSPDRLCGDFSPNYSKRDVFPEVAARLHAANPDARLIYIVRDPVARAISHYGHSFRMGQDLPEPEALAGSDAGQHILAASRYAYQMEPWLDCFPSENFLLIDFDELTGRTDQVLALTCSFLGLAAPGPESMITASKNSAEDLAALPGWWLRLRETGLGDRLRAALPRPLTRTAKKFFARETSAAPLPVFPDHVRAQLAECLADDAARFRQMTGKAFAGWSV